MSNLLNEQESNYQEPISPGAKQAILLGATRFHSVQKLCKGYDEKYKQMYADLPEIQNDRSTFEMLVTQHGF